MATRLSGHPLIELDSVDSTNKYAADRLHLPELQHGTVILAHEQTQGRGQRERTWSSNKGLDLTFSLVLRPKGLKAAGQFVLAKVAALAVHAAVVDALRAASGLGVGAVHIKWPNDVLIGDRKVAGILIHSELAGERITASIVGIGLNVNSSELHAAPGATSLRNEVGHALDRLALLEDLLARFDAWWGRASTAPGEVDAAYAAQLWGRDRAMDLELDGVPFSGVPVDVDPAGRLRVRDLSGTEQAYGLDRLRFVPRYQ
ncbi:MAG: biotin--[acetyl-CoA-carboxylase] ligase [Flavobacteriales bacterium]|nr:biotin--[acetyl-CoA-carboxylase] ligase [Flavobacteriales bacterium]